MRLPIRARINELAKHRYLVDVSFETEGIHTRC